MGRGQEYKKVVQEKLCNGVKTEREVRGNILQTKTIEGGTLQSPLNETLVVGEIMIDIYFSNETLARAGNKSFFMYSTFKGKIHNLHSNFSRNPFISCSVRRCDLRVLDGYQLVRMLRLKTHGTNF